MLASTNYFNIWFLSLTCELNLKTFNIDIDLDILGNRSINKYKTIKEVGLPMNVTGFGKSKLISYVLIS